MLVREIAGLLGTSWEGDGDRNILRVAALESAGLEDIAFIASTRAAKAADNSAAGCLIAPMNYVANGEQPVIRAQDPRSAIALVIPHLHPKRQSARGVHPTAIIAPSAILGDNVAVAAYASVGDGARIGAGVTIGTGSVIGDAVEIGEGGTIYPHVTIYPNVSIGRRVVLHSGSVIGADGFGFVMRAGAWENFPQIGRVEIGDDVEIGANSCVDRAALGVTSIGNGTKLDNMVHIGHNCRIGRHVVIAAQTGLAGGVLIDDYAVIGGQVGVGDKAHIESKAVVGSGAGILTSKIVRSGQVVWGTPARPLKEYLEQLAALSQLRRRRRRRESTEKG